MRRCIHTHISKIYILQSDIDECTQGLAGCSHNCDNTLGSYSCSCRKGFQLLSDNHNCAGNQ